MQASRCFCAISLCSILGISLWAESRPAGRHPDVERLSREAVALYGDTLLFPQSTKWLEIPWIVDLNEGIRLAKAENRPVLIWVSGDDPLERC